MTDRVWVQKFGGSSVADVAKIKASGAQGVFLGGLICENGGKLIKDIGVTAD